MDMYCPKCDLKIAGETASECPICNTTLVSEVEAGLSEAVFREGGPGEKGGDPGGNREFEGLLGASTGKLEFDPVALGLTPAGNGEELPGDEDISALAEMWNNEDIDAELDRVLGEAMTPVESPAAGENGKPLEIPVEIIETGVRPETRDAAGREPEREGEAGPGPFSGLEPESVPGADGAVAASGAAASFVDAPAFNDEPSTPVPEDEPPVIFESVTAPPEERGHGPLIVMVIVLLVIGGAVGGYLYWAGQRHRAGSDRTPAATLPTVEVGKKSTKRAPAETASRPQRPKSAPAAVAGRPKPAARETAVRAAAGAVGEKSQLAVRETPAVTGPVQATPLPEAVKKASRPNPGAAKAKAPEKASRRPVPVQKAARPAGKTGSGKKTALAGKTAPLKKPAPVQKAATATAAPAVTRPLIVKKTPVLPVVKSGYVLHAGSFKDSGKARTVAARYRKAGFGKVYTVRVDLKGKGTWYRVLIPAGGSQAEAVKVRLKFSHKYPGEPSRIMRAGK